MRHNNGKCYCKEALCSVTHCTNHKTKTGQGEDQTEQRTNKQDNNKRGIGRIQGSD